MYTNILLFLSPTGLPQKTSESCTGSKDIKEMAEETSEKF